MQWLKRVSDYAVKHGRTPIFWDDMVFKHVGLYAAILDQIPPQQVDSVWQKQLPELNKHIKSFPKKVIYMRWQYGNADQPGNKKALQWYHDNKLKTMGATAVQTTYAMLPLGGFINNIKSFQTARQDIPIEGVLRRSSKERFAREAQRMASCAHQVAESEYPDVLLECQV